MLKLTKSAAFAAAFAISAGGGGAYSVDKITLQLNWKHQAEYAGYYVARAKGWYADENLEVEIRPATPTDDVVKILTAGDADVIVEFLDAGLMSLEQGAPLVNIAQPFKHNGLSLICRRNTGIQFLDNLRGKKNRPCARPRRTGFVARVACQTEHNPEIQRTARP